MEAITLLIAVVALIIAILAYQRTGGTSELIRKIESGISSDDLKKQMDALTTMTDVLKRKNCRCIGSIGEGHPENRKRRINLTLRG